MNKNLIYSRSVLTILCDAKSGTVIATEYGFSTGREVPAYVCIVFVQAICDKGSGACPRGIVLIPNVVVHVCCLQSMPKISSLNFGVGWVIHPLDIRFFEVSGVKARHDASAFIGLISIPCRVANVMSTFELFNGLGSLFVTCSLQAHDVGSDLAKKS